MAGFGLPELLILLLVVTLLFGGSRIPKLARSVGTASREFRDGLARRDDGERTGPGAEA